MMKAPISLFAGASEVDLRGSKFQLIFCGVRRLEDSGSRQQVTGELPRTSKHEWPGDPGYDRIFRTSQMLQYPRKKVGENDPRKQPSLKYLAGRNAAVPGCTTGSRARSHCA